MSDEYKSVKTSKKTHAILMKMKKLYELSSQDETMKKALISLIDRTIINLQFTDSDELIDELCGLRRELMPKMP